MNQGKREPLGVGALIWDETKVSFVVIAVHAIKLIIAIPCSTDTYLQCITFNSHPFQGFNYYNPVPLQKTILTSQMNKYSFFNLGTIKDCVEFHEFQNHWVCHEP